MRIFIYLYNKSLHILESMERGYHVPDENPVLVSCLEKIEGPLLVALSSVQQVVF